MAAEAVLPEQLMQLLLHDVCLPRGGPCDADQVVPESAHLLLGHEPGLHDLGQQVEGDHLAHLRAGVAAHGDGEPLLAPGPLPHPGLPLAEHRGAAGLDDDPLLLGSDGDVIKIDAII